MQMLVSWCGRLLGYVPLAPLLGWVEGVAKVMGSWRRSRRPDPISAILRRLARRRGSVLL